VTSISAADIEASTKDHWQIAIKPCLMIETA
jgi:hypothetical protein